MKAQITILLFLLCSVCFAQLNLEVAYDKKTILVFPADIDGFELGNNKQTVIEKDGDKLKMKSTADFSVAIPGEDPFYETNLVVWCEDGSYFTFTINYAGDPKKFFHVLSLEQAAYIDEYSAYEKGRDNESSRGGSGSDGDLGAYFSKSAKSLIDAEDVLFDQSIVNKKLEMKVGGIYADTAYLFIEVSLWNYSNIPYDLELFSFVTKSKAKQQRRKKTSSQEYKYPVYIHNREVRRLDPQGSVNKVFVFEKFTIDSDKVFFIEVKESGGDRNLEYGLRSRLIINAERLSDII